MASRHLRGFRHGRPSNATARRFGSYICGSFLQTIPKRGERMTSEAVGIYFDYSKHLITDETLRPSSATGGGVRSAGPRRCHVSR
jgi:hypothetical protein